VRRRLATALALLAVALATGACGREDLPVIGGGETTVETVAQPPEATATVPVLDVGDGGCDPTEPPRNDSRPSFEEPPPSPLQGPGPWTVTLTTSCGPIAIALDPGLGGDAAASFAALARAGFYDSLSIHRVVPGFVVQGGDPRGDGSGGPGYTVATPPPGDYRYRNGDVAMAKAANEPPGTAGSQFFIVSTESGGAMLTPDYAVIGRVVDEESLTTVRRIDRLGIDDGPPAEPVWIWTARLAQGQ
jgi:peptidyl-prolyl cis-trans isomerase B (cyclophilin B)